MKLSLTFYFSLPSVKRTRTAGSCAVLCKGKQKLPSLVIKSKCFVSILNFSQLEVELQDCENVPLRRTEKERTRNDKSESELRLRLTTPENLITASKIDETKIAT